MALPHDARDYTKLVAGAAAISTTYAGYAAVSALTSTVGNTAEQIGIIGLPIATAAVMDIWEGIRQKFTRSNETDSITTVSPGIPPPASPLNEIKLENTAEQIKEVLKAPTNWWWQGFINMQDQTKSSTPGESPGPTPSPANNPIPDLKDPVMQEAWYRRLGELVKWYGETYGATTASTVMVLAILLPICYFRGKNAMNWAKHICTKMKKTGMSLYEAWTTVQDETETAFTTALARLKAKLDPVVLTYDAADATAYFKHASPRHRFGFNFYDNSLDDVEFLIGEFLDPASKVTTVHKAELATLYNERLFPITIYALQSEFGFEGKNWNVDRLHSEDYDVSICYRWLFYSLCTDMKNHLTGYVEARGLFNPLYLTSMGNNVILSQMRQISNSIFTETIDWTERYDKLVWAVNALKDIEAFNRTDSIASALKLELEEDELHRMDKTDAISLNAMFTIYRHPEMLQLTGAWPGYKELKQAYREFLVTLSGFVTIVSRGPTKEATLLSFDQFCDARKEFSRNKTWLSRTEVNQCVDAFSSIDPPVPLLRAYDIEIKDMEAELKVHKKTMLEKAFGAMTLELKDFHDLDEVLLFKERFKKIHNLLPATDLRDYRDQIDSLLQDLVLQQAQRSLKSLAGLQGVELEDAVKKVEAVLTQITDPRRKASVIASKDNNVKILKLMIELEESFSVIDEMENQFEFLVYSRAREIKDRNKDVTDLTQDELNFARDEIYKEYDALFAKYNEKRLELEKLYGSSKLLDDPLLKSRFSKLNSRKNPVAVKDLGTLNLIDFSDHVRKYGGPSRPSTTSGASSSGPGGPSTSAGGSAFTSGGAGPKTGTKKSPPPSPKARRGSGMKTTEELLREQVTELEHNLQLAQDEIDALKALASPGFSAGIDAFRERIKKLVEKHMAALKEKDDEYNDVVSDYTKLREADKQNYERLEEELRNARLDIDNLTNHLGRESILLGEERGKLEKALIANKLLEDRLKTMTATAGASGSAAADALTILNLEAEKIILEADTKEKERKILQLEQDLRNALAKVGTSAGPTSGTSTPTPTKARPNNRNGKIDLDYYKDYFGPQLTAKLKLANLQKSPLYKTVETQENIDAAEYMSQWIDEHLNGTLDVEALDPFFNDTQTVNIIKNTLKQIADKNNQYHEALYWAVYAVLSICKLI